VFYEEELDVPLVLFNEVLDHVLRIDRIFRQPQVSEQNVSKSAAFKARPTFLLNKKLHDLKSMTSTPKLLCNAIQGEDKFKVQSYP